MISYDSIGNPIGYSNGTQYTFAWENGRQLKSVDKVKVNPETEIATTEHILDFEYNRDGVRTNKYVSGVANYTYKMENGRLVTMLCDDENGQRQFRFSYDGTGRPYGFTYSIRGSSGSTQYYYITNLQGDVIGIMNSSRQVIAKYRYDAWGKLISMTDASGAALGENTIGARNPLRYRGYIYDSETGFYYLQTRYYDPVVQRFISADGYVSTGTGFTGYNMFAYCNNDPVNRIDPTGQFFREIFSFVKTVANEICNAVEALTPAYAGCVGAAMADGPLPIGDAVAAVGAVLLTAGAIGYGIYQAAKAPAVSIPKTEEKAEAIPAPSPNPTVIYRYGGTNPGNLTPKAKDKYTGLSFSTVPMPGAAMTTIEALNATGVGYAVQDGPSHVSVRPVGAAMDAWIIAGSGSIWTQAVKSVVIKWDGGHYTW